MAEVARPLYHFTCIHCAPSIAEGRRVLPASLLTRRNDLPPWSSLAWFTDLDQPAARPLGLTHEAIDCDRTAHRFLVLDPRPIRAWLDCPELCGTTWGKLLEAAPGAMPAHWYVSAEPVAVAIGF